MLEQQRQAYLNALGVDSWFPRVEIPGAKPAPVLRQEQFAPGHPTPTHPTPLQPTSAETTSAEPRSPQAPLEQAVVIEDVPSLEGQSVVTAQSVGQEIAPSFALKVELIGQKVLLVTDLQDPHAPDYSAQEHLLKKDIVFALGLANATSQQFVFHWPLVSNQQLNQSRLDAAQALAGVLSARLGQAHYDRVILLGSFAAQMVLNRHSAFESILQEAVADTANAIAVLRAEPLVSYSLIEMLRQPRLKRHLLSRIAPLVSAPLTAPLKGGAGE